MTITGALYTGLTGLGANADALAVAGDNISNVNTIGYRGARTAFEDILGRSIVGVGEIGGGVRLARIDKLFNQGAVLASARSTDMAISGSGFFVVHGVQNGIDGDYFTRAGQFTVDKDGFLVNPNGLIVQGYAADASGVFSTLAGDIVIGPQRLPPQATTTVSPSVNLNSQEIALVVAGNEFDPADPATFHFTTSTVVYDSRGAAHEVTIHYTRRPDVAAGPNIGDSNWEWNATVDGGEIQGGTAGTPTVIARGELIFNPDGTLQEQTATANALAGGVASDLTPTFNSAAGPQIMTFDFGDDIATGGTGLAGSTSFAQESAITALSQDGFAAGDLVQTETTPDGIITGIYSNGQRRSIARVAIATFRNVNGLAAAGGTVFAETRDSGSALLGVAGAGGRGSVQGSSLEQSNVDISQQFVNLIVHQRGYQASTRTIITADEMSQETLNIKR